MKKSWIWKTAALIGAGLLCVCAPTATESASADTVREFPCVYSASEKSEFVYYGSSEVITYTASQAEAEGIPAGYADSVLSIKGLGADPSCGMLLDFSAEEIPVSELESITFRVYIEPNAGNTGSRPQVRIADPADIGSAWIWQPGSTPTPTGEWTDVVVPKTDKFSSITKDGYLHKFEISMRANAVTPFYIDSITVNMDESYTPPEIDESDKEAPVIALAIDEITVTAGTKPMLQASATDNSGSVTLSYAWSDGALDEFGNLTAGVHTWTVTATDPSKNSSTKTVTVIVTADEELGDNVVDEEQLSTRYTVTFDGKDEKEYTYGWKVEKPVDPVKADEEGISFRFLGWYLGDTAWDFEKDTVTGNIELVSKWEEVRAKYTVTFDGKNGAEYEYGDKVEKPADPTKKESVQNYYVFDGWYNGDKKWNFNVDTVSGNLDLVAKFTEHKQSYTVTFDNENGVEYGYGEKIQKPEDPTKDGYAFIGWFKGTLEWKFDEYTVTGDLNLTAKWKKTDGDSSDKGETSDGTDSKDSGCGSIIGASAVGLTLIGAAALLLKKKGE